MVSIIFQPLFTIFNFEIKAELQIPVLIAQFIYHIKPLELKYLTQSWKKKSKAINHPHAGSKKCYLRVDD